VLLEDTHTDKGDPMEALNVIVVFAAVPALFLLAAFAASLSRSERIRRHEIAEGRLLGEVEQRLAGRRRRRR